VQLEGLSLSFQELFLVIGRERRAGFLQSGILDFSAFTRLAPESVGSSFCRLSHSSTPLLGNFYRLVPSLTNSAGEASRGIAFCRWLVRVFPFERRTFHAKRDREFRVNLPTIFTLEVCEEDFFDTFNSVLSVRDGIEGDGC